GRKMTEKDVVTLCAVGDVVAFHENPESAFEYVGPILRGADITFAQNERHYSDRRDINPLGGFTEITSPKHAEALKLGGFDVMSFASNHSVDMGPEVMMETVNLLKKLGFAVVGAGNNIEEARKPAIIKHKGTKVAFLAYTSLLRGGYPAGPERGGPAPMRAWCHYNPVDTDTGSPPQILTFPYRDDLDALIEDVKKAKAQADLVALSLHWGVHFWHGVIAMYQKEVAHAAIDAGADIILGHHPHQLKGIEVYKGKPIFYSMGNFVLDLPYDELIEWKKKSPPFNVMLEHYRWEIDPEWRVYPYPQESRKSMIVRCNIVNKNIQRACFLPVMINQRAQPRVVSREDKDFDEIFDYMQEITESQGLKTKYSIDGNEIVVSLE
ncbi:CapA family protein, partial [Chloroflexota bacterium]